MAIQDFDGDAEEIDLESGYAMNIEPRPPEDLTGPMDDIERGYLGYSDTGAEGREWSDLTPAQIERRLSKREETEAELPEGESEQFLSEGS